MTGKEVNQRPGFRSSLVLSVLVLVISHLTMTEYLGDWLTAGNAGFARIIVLYVVEVVSSRVGQTAGRASKGVRTFTRTSPASSNEPYPLKFPELPETTG